MMSVQTPTSNPEDMDKRIIISQLSENIVHAGRVEITSMLWINET
jgi:hypothetical protein